MIQGGKSEEILQGDKIRKQDTFFQSLADFMSFALFWPYLLDLQSMIFCFIFMIHQEKTKD